MQNTFEKHIKHDALKKKLSIRLKKTEEKNRLELLNREQFLFGFFFNKLNANNLIAVVNTDPKTRTGFRGIWRKPETDRQDMYK